MGTRGTGGTCGGWRSAPPTFGSWRGSSFPERRVGYGTVGTWPAFSCASRAALSPASCVASSLGTNLPEEVLEEGLGDGDAAWAASVVAPYKTAPATPPTSIDPAIAAATTVLRTPFIGQPPCFDRSFLERRDLDWRRPLSAPCEDAGIWLRPADPFAHEFRRG